MVGGPGTGKSVIALQLLGDLAKVGRNVTHATGSRSFTLTLREQLGRRAGNLFRYFNNFAHADPNDLDVLVADEAHRIRETSNSRFTKKSQRSERCHKLTNSFKLPASRCSSLTSDQVVRPGEIGTVEEIEAAASATARQSK